MTQILNENWLIVGGTGLVGTYLCELLRSQGKFVCTLSRRNRIGDSNHTVANVLDDDWLVGIDPTGYDKVVYLAFSSSNDPVQSSEINRHQALRLLNHFCPFNLQSFIYLGSMAAFGQVFEIELIDENYPKSPTGIYALEKMRGTECILSLDCEFKINVLHPTEVWSIDSNRIKSYQSLLRKNRIIFDKDGQGLKNIVHAYDVAKAVILVADRTTGGKNEEYIVNGETITWERWVHFLTPMNNEAKTIPSIFAGLTRGPVRVWLNRHGYITPLKMPKYKRRMMECKSKFSSKKIYEHTGWAPSMKFEESVIGDGGSGL